MPTSEFAFLVLPVDFDDYAWEVESKGVFWDASLRYLGKTYQLTFYEPQRLLQDIESELRENEAFFVRNLIVVDRVSRLKMETAVATLIDAGRIDSLMSE